jgi:hypothetical protein
MPKTIRYRLFKVGALPEALRAEIKHEEVLFVEEGIASIFFLRVINPEL